MLYRRRFCQQSSACSGLRFSLIGLILLALHVLGSFSNILTGYSKVCYTAFTATLGDHAQAAHRYCRLLSGIKLRGSLFLGRSMGLMKSKE